MKKGQRVRLLSKYREEFAIDAYIYAAMGMVDKKVAQALDIEIATFHAWTDRYPAFRYAIAKARDGQNGGVETFQEYVYKRLSPAMQEAWDHLCAWEQLPNGIERIEAMLSERGVRARQQLWVHAMVQRNFNASEANRAVNISRTTLQKWIEQDPDFPKLVDEIHFHKKNFFESSLFKLVKKGNVLATIFANKTQNRDRGYGSSLDVQIQGKITHEHGFNLDQLDLPLDVRLQVLAAIRKQQALTPDKVEAAQPVLELPRNSVWEEEE